MDSLVRDWRALDLPPADRAMLVYAVRLTTEPAAITAAGVEALRAAGFDDWAIHDICSVTAYYAFVNRLADGLGVELEPRFRAASEPNHPEATRPPPHLGDEETTLSAE